MTGFSKKYQHVPAELYGKHSHLVKKSDNEVSLSHSGEINHQPQPQPDAQSWTKVRYHSRSPTATQSKSKSQSQSRPPSHDQVSSQPEPTKPSQPVQLPTQLPQNRPTLKISLTRGTDGDWSPIVTQMPESASNRAIAVQAAQAAPKELSQAAKVVAGNVAGNVNSFLSGIRATFRQDNNVVTGMTRQKKSSSKLN